MSETRPEHSALDAMLHERRASRRSPAFAAAALATADALRRRGRPRRVVGPPGAHARVGRALAHDARVGAAVRASWFVGGRLNASVNCLDRHVAAGNGDRVAIHWVGEPEGDRLDLTYAELLARVSQAANALESLGVTAGDRVAIYLPMIPEAVVAMLACARIGAPHSVIFGGFAAEALVGPHPRRRRALRDHRRRRVPPGRRRAAQAPRRRGARPLPGRDGRPRRAADRAATSAGSRVGITGGTTSSTASRRPTSRRPSTPSTRCTSCTRRGRRPSPRASSTRRAATSRTSRRRTATSSTSAPRPTSCGPRRTSAG